MHKLFHSKIFTRSRSTLVIGLGLVFFYGCEEAQQLGGTELPPQVQRDITRGKITAAVNGLTDPPQVDCAHCDTEERTPTRSTGALNWNTYTENSRTSISGGIPIDDTPYGRVEWYNGTKRSTPGGGGMGNSRGSKYLDRSMLDIMPYVALAHKELGIPTRMAHTTDGTHSTNSLHYSGRAIDIDPAPDSKRRAAFNNIVSKLSSTIDPSTGKPIGCGYFVYDEISHIHVSYKGAGYSGCPGSKIK